MRCGGGRDLRVCRRRYSIRLRLTIWHTVKRREGGKEGEEKFV